MKILIRGIFYYMPVVKIFIRLELEQKVLFLDGHYITRRRKIIFGLNFGVG